MKIFLLLLSFASMALAQPIMVPQPKDWPLATEFPAAPNVKESPSSPDSMFSYFARASVVKDGTMYGIQRIVYRRTDPPRDVYAIYKAGRDLMQKAHPSTVVEEGNIEICGEPGFRYLLETKDGASRVEFRDVLITINGRFEDYLFMVEYDVARSYPVEATTFFANIKKATNKAPVPTPHPSRPLLTHRSRRLRPRHSFDVSQIT